MSTQESFQQAIIKMILLRLRDVFINFKGKLRKPSGIHESGKISLK